MSTQRKTTTTHSVICISYGLYYFRNHGLDQQSLPASLSIVNFSILSCFLFLSFNTILMVEITCKTETALGWQYSLVDKGGRGADGQSPPP